MKRQSFRALLPVVLAFVLFSCRTDGNDQTASRLDAILGASVDVYGDTVGNALLLVEAPREGLSYAAAAGDADSAFGRTLRVDSRFPLSRLGDTLLAVVAVQLAEEGAWGPAGLDATLASLEVLPGELVSGLNRQGAANHGDEITIRQLLNHTSGLRSFFTDDADGLGLQNRQNGGYMPASLGAYLSEREGVAPPSFFDGQEWSDAPGSGRSGVLNWYVTVIRGITDWLPGTRFYLSDTNTLLLRLAVEGVEGRPLEASVAERILRPLGMADNIVADASQSVAQPLISGSAGLVDPSSLVFPGWSANLENVARFVRALASGSLFETEAGAEMMTVVPFEAGSPSYAAGFFVRAVSGGRMLHQDTPSGFWFDFDEADDILVVGTANEIGNSQRFFGLRGGVFEALSQRRGSPANIRAVMLGMSLMEKWSGTGFRAFMILVGVCVLGLVSGIAAWLFTWMYRGMNSLKAPPMKERIPRFVGVGFILAALAFVNLFFLNVLQDPVQQMLGLSAELRLLCMLSPILLLFLPALCYFCVIAWQRNYWKPAHRIHYTVITVIACVVVGIVLSLGSFGLY